MNSQHDGWAILLWFKTKIASHYVCPKAQAQPKHMVKLPYSSQSVNNWKFYRIFEHILVLKSYLMLPCGLSLQRHKLGKECSLLVLKKDWKIIFFLWEIGCSYSPKHITSYRIAMSDCSYCSIKVCCILVLPTLILPTLCIL